eukprot:gene25452-1691_t
MGDNFDEITGELSPSKGSNVQSSPSSPRQSSVVEPSLMEYVVPSNFKSKLVDMNQLDPDARRRIAQMTRTRRERESAEEQMKSNARMVQGYTHEILENEKRHLVEEEQMEREQIWHTQVHYWEEIQDLWLASSDGWAGQQIREAHELSLAKQRRKKKIKRLLKKKQIEEFRGWLSDLKLSEEVHTQKQQRNTKLDSLNHDVRQLRKVYQSSIPPFPADPAELWNRGITLSPEHQTEQSIHRKRKKNAAGVPDDVIAHYPTFNDFSEKIRDGYESYKERQSRDQVIQHLTVDENQPHIAPRVAPYPYTGQPSGEFVGPYMQVHPRQHPPWETHGALRMYHLSRDEARPSSALEWKGTGPHNSAMTPYFITALREMLRGVSTKKHLKHLTIQRVLQESQHKMNRGGNKQVLQ